MGTPKKDLKFVIKEPNDGPLSKLSKDKEFEAIVLKACEDNHIRPDDVMKCIGGLYHRASCDAHGNERDIVVDGITWKKAEALALGLLFQRFNIPFKYCDRKGEFKEFPFKL